VFSTICVVNLEMLGFWLYILENHREGRGYMSIEIDTKDGKFTIENVIDFYRSPSAIRVIYKVDECIVDKIFKD
jgi:hypothetical protein